MAGICNSSVRDSGGTCEHLTLEINQDGQSRTFKTGNHDPLWSAPLTDEEWETLYRLQARAKKALGHNLANYAGRVLVGEEATNIKPYPILMKDVTKTNIGTSYVNVSVGANGERMLIDFTGCIEYRVILNANLVGTGPFGARIVRDSDNAVLYENASIALTGERELDTDWQTLPAAASGLQLVRLQAKSNVGADDPVFRRCIMLVR